MLKEQFLEAAMKALSQAYETKEKLKEAMNSEVVQSYLQGVRDMAINMLERSGGKKAPTPTQSAQPEKKPAKRGPKPGTKKAVAPKVKSVAKPVSKPVSAPVSEPVSKPVAKSVAKAAAKPAAQPEVAAELPTVTVKKERKSSIKPAKEIGSLNADKIAKWLKADRAPKLKKNDAIEGKKSLAYLVWALGHAERASIKEGISVHDVSALLFKMNKIELYPINFSRVVHANTKLIGQVGQIKRTKTYLLTPEGRTVFEKKFL